MEMHSDDGDVKLLSSVFTIFHDIFEYIHIVFFLLFLSYPDLPLIDMDAVGRPRNGILRGNLAWLGSYSECLALSSAKYCISQINVNYTKFNVVRNFTVFEIRSILVLHIIL